MSRAPGSGSITFSFPQEYPSQESYMLKVIGITADNSLSSMFQGDEMAHGFYLF